MLPASWHRPGAGSWQCFHILAILALLGPGLLVLGLVPQQAVASNDHDRALAAAARGPPQDYQDAQCAAKHVRDVLDIFNVSRSDTHTYDLVLSSTDSFLAGCLNKNTSKLRRLRMLMSKGLTTNSTNAIDLIIQRQKDAADAYFKRSGYQVIFDWVFHEDLMNQIKFSLANTPTQYDGWIFDAGSAVDLAILPGVAQPLDSYIVSDELIDWPDILPYNRQVSAVYNRSVIGIPVFGKSALMFYRKDLLLKRGIKVPDTWEELLEAAKALNGSDFNGDGKPDYAMCWQSQNCDLSSFHLSQMLAGLTQTQGTHTGWFMDPATFEFLAASEAMRKALALFWELQRYTWSASQCTVVSTHMLNGTCALSMNWDETFKSVQLTAPQLRDSIGMAQLPGWTEALNRDTGRIETCTSTSCPYATPATVNGSSRLVNRAPYIARQGAAGMVNAMQDEASKRAMFGFFALCSSAPNKTARIQQIIERYSAGPFRTSDFDTSPDSLAQWVAAGYTPQGVVEYLSMAKTTLSSPNMALDLRIINSQQYNLALGAAADAWAGRPPAQSLDVAMDKLSSRLQQILASSADLSLVQDSYRAALGFNPPPPPPSPASTDSPPPAAANSPSPSSPPASSSFHMPSVLLPVVVGTVTLLTAAALFLYFMYSVKKRSPFGQALMPPPSPDTTLVVTDIMDSTAMWETVDADVMNRTMELHDRITRRLIRKFRGYEQATEGDSFLLSFFSPRDALSFSLDLQAALLAADYEPQLLEHPGCEPVWAKLRPSLPHSLGGLLSFQEGSALRTMSSRSSATLDDGEPLKPNMQQPTGPGASSAQVPGQGERQGKVMSSSSFFSLRCSLSYLDPSGVDGIRSAEGITDAGANFIKAMRFHSQGPDLPSSADIDAQHGAEVRKPPGLQAATTPFAQSSLPMQVQGSFSGMRASSEELVLTVTDLVQRSWKQPQGKGSDPAAKLAFRGLRVRVGIHSGVEKSDIISNGTGRSCYSGVPMAVAKAVGDAGAGGMVLLSKPCFERLSPGLRSIKGGECVVLCMGEHVLKDEPLQPRVLYQAMSTDMIQRLAFFSPMRSVGVRQLGVMDAPLGQVTAAVVHMAGASSLMAWNKDQAQRAISIFGCHVNKLLREADGYLVKMDGLGTCIVAFARPVDALIWSVSLMEALKLADWDDELLEHELCEEMRFPFLDADADSRTLARINGGTQQAVEGHLSSSGAAGAALQGGTEQAEDWRFSAEGVTGRLGSSKGHLGSRMLLRGPRLRIGLDRGIAAAEVSPITGRLDYRGKVLNRASRISSRASCGSCWCSRAVWQYAQGQAEGNLAVMGILGHELGEFQLKGVHGLMDLVQFRFYPAALLRVCSEVQPSCLDPSPNQAGKPAAAETWDLTLSTELKQPLPMAVDPPR